MLRPIFVLIANLFSLVGYLWSVSWYTLGAWLRRKKRLYLKLDLRSDYEFGPRGGWAARFDTRKSFLELRDELRRLRDDDTVAGLVLHVQNTNMGAARRAEIAGMIDGLRGAGKHVVGHASMPLTGDYLILTAADDVLVSPAGRLYTFGPRFDQTFAAEALNRLGVIAQVIHIGEFKTAMHRFLHDEMPEPQRLMMTALYDSLEAAYLDRIAGRRDLEPSGADALFAQAPLDPRAALHAGLVDGEIFESRLVDWLEAGAEATPSGLVVAEQHDAEQHDAEQHDAGPGPKAEAADAAPMLAMRESSGEVIVADAEQYADGLPQLNWRPLFRRPKTLAALDLTGMIVMPDMSVPGRSAPVIDPDEVVPRLKAIASSRRHAGLLLHINSPGGSALASDIIWHAIEEVRRRKPVVAYCTDVVGSGGYYLACGADAIVCHRETIAGSIGVITGKFSAPAVPERFGLHVEGIYRRDADTFTSLTHPMSEQMVERMSVDARAFYRRFLQRVGQARRLDRRRLHRYARGRVYLGEDAARRHLVDAIGGYDEALDRLAKMCEMAVEQARVDFVAHRRESVGQLLRQSMQVASASGDAQALLSEWLEPVRVAAMLRHEPVLALMPFVPQPRH